jgi:NADH:ubiquinone oxidoreductase subunit 6 (subunit J)
MLIVLIVVNAIAYLIFFGLAVLINKAKGREAVSKRSAGNIGVALLFVILFSVAYVHIAPSLSPGDPSAPAAFNQGEQVGRIAGTLMVPAVFVAFLLGLITKKSGPK